MTDRILAELAALKAASFTELRGKWQTLFDGQAPPPYNRKYVEARLAYRLQELAYGGLKPETVERLEALADEIEGKGRQAAVVGQQTNRRDPTGPRMARDRAHASSSATMISNIRAGRSNHCRRSRAPSPARGGTAGCSLA